jgi:hypothetical protein
MTNKNNIISSLKNDLLKENRKTTSLKEQLVNNSEDDEINDLIQDLYKQINQTQNITLKQNDITIELKKITNLKQLKVGDIISLSFNVTSVSDGLKLNITTLGIIKKIGVENYEVFFYDPDHDYEETIKGYSKTVLAHYMCFSVDNGVFVLSLGNMTVLNNEVTSDAKNFLKQYKTNNAYTSFIEPKKFFSSVVTSCIASGVGGTLVGMIINNLCKKNVDKISKTVGDCFSACFTSTRSCIGNILEKLGNLLTRSKPPTTYMPLDGSLNVYDYRGIESLISKGEDIRRVPIDERIRLIESIQGDLLSALHHDMPESLRTRLIEYNAQLARLKAMTNTMRLEQANLMEEFENIRRTTWETLEKYKIPIVF